MKKNEQTSAAELRQLAEERLKNKPARADQHYSEAEILKLIFELEVHQIELELQNEELVLQNQELELAKSAQQLSNQKYIELYDFAPSGYVSLSKAGEIQKLNHAAARILGKERSHLISNHFAFFVSESSRHDFNIFIQQVFAATGKQSCELELTSHNNKPVYIHIEGVISESEEQCLVTIADITALKQSAQLLLQSEDKYSKVFQISPFAISITRQEDGKYIEINDAFTSIIGYTREEAIENSTIGLNLWANPEDRQYVVSELKRGRKVHNMEFPFITKDGNNRTGLLSAQLITLDQKPHILSCISNITDSKRVERALRESGLVYRAILQASPDGITITDMEGAVLMASAEAIATFGYKSEEEILGHRVTEFIIPEQRELAFNNIAEMLQGNANGPTEYLGLHTDGSHFYLEANGKVINDAQGNPFSIVFVFRDISERKQNEQKLIDTIHEAEQSERKFQTIVQSQAVGIGIVDANEVFEFANLAAEKIFETGSGELTGTSLFDFLEADEVEKIYQQNRNRQSGASDAYDLKIVTRKGNLKYIQVSATPKKDKNGTHQGTYGVFSDSTERILAQDSVKAKTTLLTNLIINLQEGILLENSNRQILLTNHLFCDMFGIPAPPEALIGADCTDSAEQSKVFFKNPDKFIADINVILSEKKVVLNDELELVDGRFFERDYIPTFIENTYDGHLWKYRDITQQKQAEIALQKSEEKYYSIFQGNPNGIMIVDAETRMIFTANTAQCQLLGYTHDELASMSVADIHPAETLQQTLADFEKIAKGEKTTSENIQCRKKNGDIVYADINASMVSINDRIYIVGFFKDITERRKSQESLIRLSQAVEQSPVITYITNTKGIIEYANPKAFEVCGYSREELIGHNPNIFSSGSKSADEYKNLWQTISSGKEWKGEFLNKKKNGELYWVTASISPVMDVDGKINHYLAVEEDITDRKRAEKEIIDLNWGLEIKITERTTQLAQTNSALIAEIEERKRAEEELEVSKEKYRGLSEASFDSIFISEKGKCIEQNLAAELMFGYTTEEALVRYGTEWIVPEDREKVMESMLSGYTGDYEATALRKDGTTFPCILRGRMMSYKGRDVRVTSLTDITRRKQAEEEVKQVSTRLELATVTSGMGVWDFDLQNNILVWDDQMFALYGLQTGVSNSTNTILQLADWQAFLHHDDSTRIEAEIKLAISGEKKFDTEFRIVWPNGAIRSIKALATVQLDDSGRVTHLIGTNVDITERKKSETFEHELLQLSIQLTSIHGSEISAAFNLAIKRVGSFLAADRAYIFEFNQSRSTVSNTYEWCAEGINPEIGNLQNILVDTSSQMIAPLFRHENIIIPSVKALPDEREDDRNALEMQGIQSLIVIPILHENSLFGFVGLDSVLHEREFDATEVTMLKVWSTMLAGLLNTKRTEELVEQTRRNYETFFNTIDDFLFVTDLQKNIIHVNNTVSQRLGYPILDLIGKSVLSVHPEENREEAAKICTEILAGTADICQIPLITVSGTSIPVETTVKSGFWNGEQVIFIVSKDVAKIKLSEEKFSKAFQSNSAMMSISGYEDERFIEVNNTFLTTLGYSLNEIIGNTKANSIFINKDLRRTLIENLKQHIPVREVEMEIRTTSGSIITTLFSVDYIYIANELCLLTVMVDITGRKHAEEEIRMAKNEAEKANLAKSEFLSRMSHELRTPMNSILGFAQLMEMGELIPAQKKGVHHILKSGKHLLNLINEVLDISRIEAGQLSLSLEPVQLASIIGDTLESVQLNAQKQNLVLKLIDSPVNRMHVKADNQRLKQVLLNLINNAIKYNRNGGSVTIKTELRELEAPEISRIRISVTDTGKGIKPEYLEKLFLPFERIGAEKTETEGTGLGLTVVKKLMDAMGGQFGVVSTPGEGSTFWIELQFTQSQKSLSGLHGNVLSGETALPVKTGTILYIEDNVSNAELVKDIISDHRPAIQLVSSMYGVTAVSLAAEYKPDLILLDLDLPDMHGSKVLGNLQADKATSSIPVVIISADAMPQQIERLMHAGARNYLAKPLDIKEFLLMIDEWVGNR
jgi:PAS domain S-box-containing protein